MTAAAQATAVIAAAGSGERLGGEVPKALVEVAGRPLLAWSLEAFAAASATGAIVVAAPPGQEDEVKRLAPAGVPLAVVAGGTTRAESVAAALAQVEADFVAIHDAARPLVEPGLIDAVIARLAGEDGTAGVIAATPISDTVKRAAAPREGAGTHTIAATEDRDLLWVAQTPQAFRTEALREAIGAPGDGPAPTDEAMLVERAGGIVLLHASPATNLKVTTPEDLRLAELLLAQRLSST